MSVGRLNVTVRDRRYRNLVIERIGLKAAAVATWTRRVGTIAAEQNAHVHFVNLGLGPAEKTPHAVPAVAVVIIIAVAFSALARGGDRLLAFYDKLLIGFRQFLE